MEDERTPQLMEMINAPTDFKDTPIMGGGEAIKVNVATQNSRVV